MMTLALPAAPGCPLRQEAERLTARATARDPLSLDEMRDLSLSLAEWSDAQTQARGGDLDAVIAALPPGAMWRVGHDGEGADPGTFRADLMLDGGQSAFRRVTSWAESAAVAMRRVLAVARAGV